MDAVNTIFVASPNVDETLSFVNVIPSLRASISYKSCKQTKNQ